jgi:hypothetical protein
MKLPFLMSCLCVAVCSIPTAATASAADANRAFSIQASRWLMSGQVQGEATVQLAPPTQRSRGFSFDYTCLRDGARIESQTVRYEGGLPIRGWRSIVDGFYVSYQAPPRGKSALSGYFAKDGARFSGAAIPSCLAPFLGFFAGDFVSLSEIERSAPQISTSETRSDGFPCQTVTLDSPDFGHYQVSYDPSVGYLPRWAQVQKSGRNLVGQQRLDEGPPRTQPGSTAPTPIVELLFILDQVKFDQVQGKWFPLSCRITRVLRYGDRNSETTVMLWHRSSLQLDPAPTADAFKPEFRQGAQLTNLAESHLPLQWKDGQAVPLVDPKLVTQMNQTADALRREREKSAAGTQ